MSDAPRAACQMTLTVQATGIAPFAVEKTFDVWTSSWPSPGDALPVVFDLEHHDRIEIQWDRMQPGWEQARRQAQVVENAWVGVPADVTDPAVEGTALVNNVWGHGSDALWGPLELDLTVQGPGVEPVRLRKKFKSVRTKKWPMIGQTLPVTFKRGRPEKLKVDWGRVPTRADGTMHQLAGAADWLRGGDGGAGAQEIVEVSFAGPAPPSANVLDEL